MIAHLVGGPMNGKEFGVSEFPHRIIETPAPIKPVVNWWSEDQPLPLCDFKTDSYRLIKSNGRQAIYEWVPPKLTANFAFTIQAGLDEGLCYRKARELLDLEGEVVNFTSIHYDSYAISVAGLVTVDGPADAYAAEAASAAVKQVIERKLRFYQITQFAVDVSDG
jgi:hypothetical protein